MIRDLPDTTALVSFVVMGVLFAARAETWAGRICFGLGTIVGVAIPVLLARRNARRARLRELLEDLALYDQRPEPHEDVPTFLMRVEHDVARPLGWQLRSPIKTEQARAARVLLANYRRGRS